MKDHIAPDIEVYLVGQDTVHKQARHSLLGLGLCLEARTEVIGLVASTPVPSLMYLQPSNSGEFMLCMHTNHGGNFASVSKQQMRLRLVCKAAQNPTQLTTQVWKWPALLDRQAINITHEAHA